MLCIVRHLDPKFVVHPVKPLNPIAKFIGDDSMGIAQENPATVGEMFDQTAMKLWPQFTQIGHITAQYQRER